MFYKYSNLIRTATKKKTATLFQIDGGSEQLTKHMLAISDLRASVQYILCTNVCTFGFLHLSHFIHSLTKRLHIAVSTYESFPHSLTLFHPLDSDSESDSAQETFWIQSI